MKLYARRNGKGWKALTDLPEKTTPPEASPQTVNDPFADELAARIAPFISGDQRTAIIAQVVSAVQEERFSGPIAHPKHLREYDRIVPGSANRIIAMAEGELSHNQRVQELALAADIHDRREGRRLGFGALILLITAALGCGLTGHDALAAGFLCTGVLGVVGSFIKGRG